MRFLLALLVLLPFGGKSHAISPISEILCSTPEEMRERLTVRMQARKVAFGVRDREQVMEVWQSDVSGDWAMVVTYASGTSCIVAMGEDWTPL